MIGILSQYWELVASVTTGIGALVGWLFGGKIRKASGDKELMQLINEMKINLSEISKQSIKNEEIISKLSQKINAYQTALHKLTLLCDIMCDKKQQCKEKIQEVLNELGLDKSIEYE
jgi:hypothetical protein